MEIVTRDGSPASELDWEDVDVIITGRDDPQWASRLMLRHAETRVLALTGGGREGLLYELRPHRIALGEVSPRQLVAEIRGRHPLDALIESNGEGKEVS